MNTKRSLFTSIISLLLCFSMLLGTTFAWFTDSVSSTGNKIQSGTLKLDLLVLGEDDGKWTSVKDSNAPIFNYDKWEPGYTDVTIFKVENLGTLALKWVARFASEEALSKLAEVIDVYVCPGVAEQYPNGRELDSSWKNVGTLDKFINTISDTTYGFLDAGDSATLGIALKMREDAGNEYQDIKLGAFDIRILATQASSEKDSFDEKYDSNAAWPADMSFAVSADINQVALNTYGEIASDFIIRYNDSIYALLPAGVKLASDIDSLKFSGKAVENGSNISLGKDDSAASFDIHIEGIAPDNETPITVYLGGMLNKDIGDTSLKLYHEDVQMRRVNAVADFATNNQFTYDSATGDVVIYVTNFSVFSALETTADVWDGETSDTTWYNESGTEFTLESVEQFAGFRDLVDGGNTFSGKTVKLGTDIDLADKSFDPIGFGYYDAESNTRVFMGIFDGAGYTVYNLYENCWELDPDKDKYSTYTYSTAGAGLFASIKDATVKNLAVSGANIVFECVDMGVVVGYAQGTCHFENIVVTDSKIGNYNRYTGGVVGEVSYGPYGTDTNKGYSHTFKNIVVDSSVKVSGLWGSFGCGMGGVIGGKYGDATVKMENVISAAEMDVFNDVTSAYQWYAFRGCGMLIGHTEEPYSDGRHSGNATASFLTCENVIVYYGDWVNYEYYQFTNQTDENDNSLWYSNYPWVRAEEGEHNAAFSNPRYGNPIVGGVKINTVELAEANKTGYTTIVFDQLYGADRGMYGTATHEGVTVHYKNTKTVYIHNNLGWTDLKLDYWYANGEETWTNLVDPIAIKLADGEDKVYKVEVPAYADSFKISSADNAEEVTFKLSEVADGENINLAGEHIHVSACVCGAVRFEFGENGKASHYDGSGASEYTETVSDYTLTLTGSGVYKSANDALGNSCLKLGTASVIGSFTFTVPESVTSVIIYVAKYKDNASKITVNSTEYELTKNSNDGAYDEIVIDTKETKTVKLATTESTKRCMVNSIVFIAENLDHEHSYESAVTDPTCTEDGYTTYTCSICAHTYVEAGDKKTGHSYTEKITTEATCTEKGVKTLTCSVCKDIQTETISKTPHNYNGGECTVCSAIEPTLEITKDDFNSTSYAANNNTKTEGDYSYTSEQVMKNKNAMQWQSGAGYITISSNEFVKLELEATEGAFTVTVGGKTVTGTENNGVITYDLTGLTGEIKISVGSETGYVDYIRFYK